MKDEKKQSIEQILRSGILLSFVASIAVLAAIFIPSIYFIQKKNALDEINQETEKYTNYIQTHIHNVYLRLMILGKNHFIVNSLVNPEQSKDNLYRLLKGEVQSYFVKKVLVVNSGEKIVYQTETGDTTASLGLYLRRSSVEGEIFFAQDITGTRYFISAPILYYKTPQGSLLFEIDLQNLMEKIRLPKDTQLYLNLEGIEFGDVDLENSYLQVSKTFKYQEVSKSYLLLHIGKNRIFTPIYRFTFIYLLLIIVFIFGAIGFSHKITQKILHPLMTLKKMIEGTLNLDKMKVPIPEETLEITSIRELFYQQALELKEVNIDLEKRVLERTKELKKISEEHIFYKNAIINATIVMETDSQANFTDVNDNFCHISGYSREELISKNINIVSSGYHGNEFWKELWETISAGLIWRNEIRNKKKNGDFYWVDAFVIPKIDSQNKVIAILSIQNDITNSKEIEQQVIKEKEKAEYATEAKSQFLATMSHEIRTPMNAILAMGEMLYESSHLSEEERGYLEVLNNSGKTLVQLINDILDFSKIENGAIDFEQEIFDLDFLAKEIVGLFRPLAEKKGIAFNLIVDAKNSIRIGDTTRIKQVFFNLMGNALKFTTEGSISVLIRDDQDNIYVEISDTGIGIPEEKQKKIFERFGQADASINRQFGGTGLGLNISLSLIELMGGKISLKSEVGVGSTFSFNLKLLTSSKEKNIKKEMGVISKEQLKNLKGEILIVDDALVNIEVLQLFLKNTQIKIETAVNGEMALKILSGKTFDLVFMDIEMPVMDGITAVKKLRVHERYSKDKNKVVALSAHAMEGLKKEVLNAGFDFYMTKPISKQKFHRFLIEQLSPKSKQSKEKQAA